jgi:hypothetical protein
VLLPLLAAALVLVLADDEPTTPDGVYKLAALDLAERVPPEKRRVTRYLSLHAVPPAERPKFLQSLVFALNSTSFRSQLAKPLVLGDDRLLVRVDLEALGWDRESRAARRARLKLSGVDFKLSGEAERLFDDVWESFVAKDPYWKVSQEQGGKFVRGWLDPVVEEATRNLGQSASFILSAQWLLPRLLVEEAQGGFYSTLLMFPPDEADFYKGFGIDIKLVDRDPQLKVGGAVLQSVVALHNRELQLIPNPYGYDVKFFWRTFDVLNDAERRKNVLETYGGQIQHDGRETIFSLPNGLHGYQLYDAKGKQVSVVPQAIALDMRRDAPNRDRNVLNAIACISCHGPVAGTQPFVDVVRASVLDPAVKLIAESNDKRKLADFTASLEDYYRLAEKGGIERDVVMQQESYARRVEAINDLDPGTNSERLVGWYDRYVWDLVTPEQAAREMGLAPERARAVWKAYARPKPGPVAGDRLVSQLAVLSAGHPIRRAAWERAFADAMRSQVHPWEKSVTVGGGH